MKSSVLSKLLIIFFLAISSQRLYAVRLPTSLALDAITVGVSHCTFAMYICSHDKKDKEIYLVPPLMAVSAVLSTNLRPLPQPLIGAAFLGVGLGIFISSSLH